MLRRQKFASRTMTSSSTSHELRNESSCPARPDSSGRPGHPQRDGGRGGGRSCRCPANLGRRPGRAAQGRLPSQKALPRPGRAGGHPAGGQPCPGYGGFAGFADRHHPGDHPIFDEWRTGAAHLSTGGQSRQGFRRVGGTGHSRMRQGGHGEIHGRRACHQTRTGQATDPAGSRFLH